MLQIVVMRESDPTSGGPRLSRYQSLVSDLGISIDHNIKIQVIYVQYIQC